MFQDSDGNWFSQNSKTNEIRPAKFPGGATPKSLTKPNSGGGMQGTPEQQAAYADAIVKGTMPPPSPTQLGRQPGLAAELSKRGIDVTQATLDYYARQRGAAAANSNPQLRLRQAIDFAGQSTDKIEQLFGELQKTGIVTGSQPVNKALQWMATKGSGDASKYANILKGQMADLTGELASVYMAGGVPTDNAFKLAKENLDQAWNAPTFAEGINQIRQNLTNRSKSIVNTQPILPGAQNRGAAPAQAPAPSGGQQFTHISASGKFGWDGKQWVPINP